MVIELKLRRVAHRKVVCTDGIQVHGVVSKQILLGGIVFGSYLFNISET